MMTFIISFCFIVVAMLAMGIGLFFGKQAVNSGCSGLGKIVASDLSCELCSGQCNKKTNL